jgi:mitogen-activated protein kinase kinase kinase 13
MASSSRPARSRGKTKQVEFSEQVQVASVESLSDLTLSDDEPYRLPKNPSPRRLRSQGGRTARTPPKRDVKTKTTNPCEDEDEDKDEIDDEIDEIASSRDATPPPVITDRTPVKRRLRPRLVQTHTPPDESDDGDDEEEEEEEEPEGATEDAASVDIAEEDDSNEEEDDVTLVEPRKLRNGKIVGEEEGLEVIDEQEGSEESTPEDIVIEEDIDLEADNDDDESEESSHDEFTDEAMEDGAQLIPFPKPF